MRAGLFILPFLALLLGAFGMVIGSAFPLIVWVKYAGWAVAAALIGLWVSLDFDGFKRAFLRKGAKYGASAGLVVILGTLCIVGVAFLGSKPTFNKQFDVTKGKVNTLADQTEKMVHNLKEKNLRVQVVAFFSSEQTKQGFEELFKRYQKLGDIFDVTYYHPKADPDKAVEFNITADDAVVFKAGAQEARVLSFSEEKITNALAKIQKEQTKKIYFLKGHGEPQIRTQQDEMTYNVAVAELENNKYTVDELSLLQKPEIPKDANLIIIAGPKYDLSVTEVTQLEQYLKGGGALFVAVDAASDFPQLSALMAKCGLALQDDFLILPPGDRRALAYGRTTAFVTKFDDYNPATRDFANHRGVTLLVPNARSITVNETNELSLKPTLIGKTAGDVVAIKGVKTQKDLAKVNPANLAEGEFGVFAVAAGKAALGDVAANDPTAASKKDGVAPNAGEHKPEIRVVLVGSSQFLIDGLVRNAAQNLDMFMNLANYLVQEEDFIAIKPREAGTGTIDVSSGWSQLYLLSASFLYSFVFLGGGIVYWLRRRKA